MSLERIATALERLAGITQGPETSQGNVAPQTGTPTCELPTPHLPHTIWLEQLVGGMVRDHYCTGNPPPHDTASYERGWDDALAEIGADNLQQAQQALNAWQAGQTMPREPEHRISYDKGHMDGRLELLNALGCETEEEAQQAVRAWRYIQGCKIDSTRNDQVWHTSAEADTWHYTAGGLLRVLRAAEGVS